VVLLFAFVANLIPELVFNWDATTFSCGNDEHNKRKVYVSSVPRSEWENLVPPSVLGSNLGVYIKKYHYHNSFGQVAHPVYMVADDSIAEGEFEVFKVFGMGATNAVGDFGFLVLSNTRAGHDAFYAWYATHIVLPYIREVRQEVGDRGKVTRTYYVYDN
jgi:hypothetical protein